MNNLKLPPQNLEAERAVIGSVMIDNATLFKVADILTPECFYDLRHSILFESIIDLYKENKPVDVLTLTSELKKKNKLKQSGGTSYIPEIVNSVPSAANVEEYAKIVKEEYTRRQLISFSTFLAEESRKEDKKLDEIMNEVEAKVFSMSVDSNVQDFYDSKTLLELHIQRADEYAKNPNAMRGIPTGLKSVDEILGGLHKSDLVILAARPSVGKSAFVFNVARHMAVNEKKCVAIFSLEMPAIQVFERMLAAQSQIDLWSLRMSQLKDNDYARFSEGASKLAEAKIFIDDTAGINIMQLRSKARKLMIEHSLDLLVIDYLQLMQGGTKSDNRAQEIGEISRSLKILARELNIPVVALSQLNRAVENRQDRVPQLSDLRESGSIEQDADLVMFLSREMTAEEAMSQDNESIRVDLHIAKHRNGPIGRVPLEYIGRQTRFQDAK